MDAKALSPAPECEDRLLLVDDVVKEVGREHEDIRNQEDENDLDDVRRHEVHVLECSGYPSALSF